MNAHANPNPPSQTIVVQHPPSNPLGLAGLIVSVLGLFTCGLLCLPGALLSFFALFSRGPKGIAVLGLIVGFPGTLFFIFVGVGLLASALGIGAVATSAVGAAQQRMALEAASAKHLPANEEIEIASESPIDLATPESDNAPPEDATSQDPAIDRHPLAVVDDAAAPTKSIEQTVEDEPISPTLDETPAPLVYVFTDASGKFTIEAEVVAVKQGWVKLKRVDSDKEVTVKIEKLIERDRKWLAKHFPEE